MQNFDKIQGKVVGNNSLQSCGRIVNCWRCTNGEVVLLGNGVLGNGVFWVMGSGQANYLELLTNNCKNTPIWAPYRAF